MNFFVLFLQQRNKHYKLNGDDWKKNSLFFAFTVKLIFDGNFFFLNSKNRHHLQSLCLTCVCVCVWENCHQLSKKQLGHWNNNSNWFFFFILFLNENLFCLILFTKKKFNLPTMSLRRVTCQHYQYRFFSLFF